MKKAIIFGTGNIACGVLGQATFQSGLHTSFVSHVPAVIHSINQYGGYLLKLIERGSHYLSIGDCDALHFDEHKKIVDTIAESEIVMSAIGKGNLKIIAPYIAAALLLRKRRGIHRPLNIIACEGLPGTSEFLYHELLSGPEFKSDVELKNYFGFASAMTNRLVLGGGIEHGELTYTADKRYELIIDGKFLKGSSLPLSEVTVCNDFSVHYLIKQFTLNYALFAAAYLGHQKACRYIHEAIAHPDIFSVLNGAVHEAQSALVSKYPEHLSDIIKSSKFAMMRLRQKELMLRIDAFTANPREKLNPQECLVSPLNMAQQQRQPFGNLAKVIAAILNCDRCETGQSMQTLIAKFGVDRILEEDCKLLAHHPLAMKVKAEYEKLLNPAKKATMYHGFRNLSAQLFNF